MSMFKSFYCIDNNNNQSKGGNLVNMQSRLEVEELDYLTKNFHLSIKPLPYSTDCIRSVDLLDGKKNVRRIWMNYQVFSGLRQE